MRLVGGWLRFIEANDFSLTRALYLSFERGLVARLRLRLVALRVCQYVAYE